MNSCCRSRRRPSRAIRFVSEGSGGDDAALTIRTTSSSRRTASICSSRCSPQPRGGARRGTGLGLVDHLGSDHQGGNHDVDFDKAGRLYVADTHNGRVTIYEISGARPSGKHIVRTHPWPGRRAGASQRPHLCRRRLGPATSWSTRAARWSADEAAASPHDVEATPEGDRLARHAGNDRMLLLTGGLQIIKELSESRR